VENANGGGWNRAGARLVGPAPSGEARGQPPSELSGARMWTRPGVVREATLQPAELKSLPYVFDLVVICSDTIFVVRDDI
jgi:hypothetical protein